MRAVNRSALRYRLKQSRATVRRQYLAWRKERNIPERCDNEGCRFHTEPLVWNGKPFNPDMDHLSGNSDDHRPENLRLLCPLCHSQQLETRGGANRGRFEKAEGGFARVSKDGTRHYVLPVEPGSFVVTGQSIKVRKI